MSPPNKISPPPNVIYTPNVIYDNVQGVCRPAEPGEEQAVSVTSIEPAKPAFRPISRSRVSAETHRRLERRKSGNPWQYGPLSLLAGCNGSDGPVASGTPVLFVDPLGGETAMNAQPIQNPGKLNGYALSGAGAGTLVAWSAFDATHPAQSGTFAFLRNGSTGGSQVTVSGGDTSMLHEFTSAAALDDGDAFVSYTLTKGTEAASSIVAQRLSSNGIPQGTVPILASVMPPPPGLPAAQLVSTTTGFVAVYRDGNGQLFAAAFDGRGVPQGTPQGLGPISDSPFSISRGTGDYWVLAQIDSSNQIRIRTFSGLKPSGVGKVTTGGFSALPHLSVAMSEEGKMMLAWNDQSGGISAAVMDAGGNVQGGIFSVTSSNSNTLSLASDHQGNFVLAWELAGKDQQTGQIIGQISARIYDGTSHYLPRADFPVISDPTRGSATNIGAYVSKNGILTLTWIRSVTTGGNILQYVVGRDYQLNY